MVFLNTHRYAALALLLISSSGCSNVFYQPDHNLYYPPEKNGYAPRNIDFKSKDGTELTGWFFPSKAPGPPRGTIIQFHGNAQNMTSHYASLVWATKEGYQLFAFDYRGYGRSDGSPNQKGVYEDGLAALDQAYELHRQSGAKLFVVYGQSLGGAIGMRAFADFPHRSETALVVMESTFMNYKDLAQEKLAQIWLTWLFSPLARLLVSNEYGTEDVIPKLTQRLLVIHDKRDPVVPFDNGEEIFKAATSCPKKDFWTEDKGRHTGFFFIDAPENRAKFLKLLGEL